MKLLNEIYKVTSISRVIFRVKGQMGSRGVSMLWLDLAVGLWNDHRLNVQPGQTLSQHDGANEEVPFPFDHHSGGILAVAPDLRCML